MPVTDYIKSPSMKSPYISRIEIKNFRNFKEVDVKLNHKQVIIGENNAGKTNLLRAIQLILDRNLSDSDRDLTISDFHDSLENPTEIGEEIMIALEVQNYDHNRQFLAQFTDAVISTNPPTLRFTYKYSPVRDENGTILRYEYKIYKGNSDDKLFGNQDRNQLNFKVIGALRDVERELRANKRSPLYSLIKQYDIEQSELDEISSTMKEAAEGILELEEIKDIKKIIENKFKTLSGLQPDRKVNLRPYDIDTERLLYTMQVYMGLKERPVSELSLGLANILYMAIMMMILSDKTVPRILKKATYDELASEDSIAIIDENYTAHEDNYILNDNIDSEIGKQLYDFFTKHNHQLNSVTILAVEEPEAHLHPVLQRLIYKEVLHKSETSVLFTTHSPYITAVAPLKTIVHCRHEIGGSKVFSTSNLVIDPKDKIDIERYLDAKRGEIYFGKGVLLVEGITEEYLVPKIAELMGKPLEESGIVVCNVHSTNFKPYVQILQALSIPWCLITDGDFYKLVIHTEEETEKRERHYHRMWQNGEPKHFRGLELLTQMALDVDLIKTEENKPNHSDKQFDLLKDKGCFVGFYTFEIDTMLKGEVNRNEILKTVYSEVRPGGNTQQKNFEEDLDNKDYWAALKKIEGNVGKGRFAQRFASLLTLDLAPEYIKEAIHSITTKVTTNHE